MDNNKSGLPPFPERRTDVAPQAPQDPHEAPTQVRARIEREEAGEGATSAEAPGGAGGGRGGHPVRNVLVGGLSGVIAAGALVLGLRATGVIGGTQIIRTTDSAAGQTVSISASGENVDVAKAVAAKALPSVASVHVSTAKGSGLGSGVVLDDKGNIITNYHVVKDATAISVTINGKSFDATLVGTDASSDLAVLHVDLGDTKVTPMEVGDSDSLVVGDWVMSIGSPFGLDQSVSAGIVSALTRNQLLESSSGATLYTNLIQVDAAINPGNSGGALVNSEGKLVGISTLYSSDTQSFAGIGFAIPGNYAVSVANKIIAGETVTHAYIGLTMQTVNAQNALRNNLPVNQGAYVASVTEGGPAAEAGIKKGDVITAMNGEAITSADGMILSVRSHSIGEKVAVTVRRGSQEQTFMVTLGSDEALQAEQQKNRTLDDGGNGGGKNGITTDQLYDYLEQIYGQRQNNDKGGSTLS